MKMTTAAIAHLPSTVYWRTNSDLHCIALGFSAHGNVHARSNRSGDPLVAWKADRSKRDEAVKEVGRR
jgi:hypothetical protein